MKGLKGAKPRGFYNTWPSFTKGKVIYCGKDMVNDPLTWFDLTPKERKKAKVARSYPGLMPMQTAPPLVRGKLHELNSKEERVVRSINQILVKQLGCSIDNDFTLNDRVRALVQSCRWELKKK